MDDKTVNILMKTMDSILDLYPEYDVSNDEDRYKLFMTLCKRYYDSIQIIVAKYGGID